MPKIISPKQSFQEKKLGASRGTEKISNKNKCKKQRKNQFKGY